MLGTILGAVGVSGSQTDRSLALGEMVFSWREMISAQIIKSKFYGVLKGDHCSGRKKVLQEGARLQF